MLTTIDDRKFVLGLAATLFLLLVALAVWSLASREAAVELELAPPIDFTVFPAGSARKQAFVDYFLPIINAANAQIHRDRVKLLKLQGKQKLNYFENNWIQELATRYRLSEFNPGNMLHWVELVKRVDVISPSLALAQSANESAWGTSRFARQGNNFFGQWCFTEGCGMVPKARSAGATHEVKIFDSATAAVQAYMKNLNTHKAYSELREIRAERRQQQGERGEVRGVDLAQGLVAYSARGLEYVSELQHMIRYNKWNEFDLVRL